MLNFSGLPSLHLRSKASPNGANVALRSHSCGGMRDSGTGVSVLLEERLIGSASFFSLGGANLPFPLRFAPIFHFHAIL